MIMESTKVILEWQCFIAVQQFDGINYWKRLMIGTQIIDEDFCTTVFSKVGTQTTFMQIHPNGGCAELENGLVCGASPQATTRNRCDDGVISSAKLNVRFQSWGVDLGACGNGRKQPIPAGRRRRPVWPYRSHPSFCAPGHRN
jgi:hypothetical protein